MALVGLDVGGRGGELLGIGEVVLVAIGYATGPMLIKHRLAGLDPRALTGASLAMAAVLLAPAVALDPPRRVPGIGAIAAVVGLGLICTALAFVIFTVLIRGAGAIAGLLLILAGSWLATDGRLRPGLGTGAAP